MPSLTHRGSIHKLRWQNFAHHCPPTYLPNFTLVGINALFSSKIPSYVWPSLTFSLPPTYPIMSTYLKNALFDTYLSRPFSKRPRLTISTNHHLQNRTIQFLSGQISALAGLCTMEPKEFPNRMSNIKFRYVLWGHKIWKNLPLFF